MSNTAECKDNSCNYVYPILETECIGNSLSSINLNFSQLNIQICNIFDNINNLWNPVTNLFASVSSNLLGALTITNTNSACWQNTCSVVGEMSGFWLKPITLVYPYPFPGDTDIVTVQNWLNDSFPIQSGNCLNFIVGQQLYIHSPEWATINRTDTQSQYAGTQYASFTYSCDCIGRGTYTGYASTPVNCGGVTVTVNIPDTFINNFVGIQFTVQPNLTWGAGVKIFG